MCDLPICFSKSYPLYKWCLFYKYKFECVYNILLLVLIWQKVVNKLVLLLLVYVWKALFRSKTLYEKGATFFRKMACGVHVDCWLSRTVVFNPFSFVGPLWKFQIKVWTPLNLCMGIHILLILVIFRGPLKHSLQSPRGSWITG